MTTEGSWSGAGAADAGSPASVEEIVEDLTALLEGARALPLSAACVIDRELALGLVDELRAALPPELAAAQRVLADREAVSRRAREEADTLLAGARQEAERLVSSARSRADELLAVARAEAEAERAAGDEQRERLVAEHDVLVEARRRAEVTLAEARQEASRLRAGAEDYVDQRLADLEVLLSRTLAEVGRGRDRLAARSSGRGDAADEAAPPGAGPRSTDAPQVG